MKLEINLKEAGSYTIICPMGELDIFNSPVLRDKIIELVKKGVEKVAIDMSKVSYIDSIGLGALVAGLKVTREKNGKLVIVTPSSYVLKIFKLTSMDNVFKIYNSVKALK
jgi:anti-sigma B factor antagonist